MPNFQLIRKLAQAQGKAMADIARECGITPTQLHSLIKKNSTKPATAQKIAASLGVPVSVFFEEDIDEEAIISQHHIGISESGNISIVHNESSNADSYKKDLKEAKNEIELLRKQIHLLEERIKDKDFIISMLQKSQIIQ